jgi:hypothetical protein
MEDRHPGQGYQRVQGGQVHAKPRRAHRHARDVVRDRGLDEPERVVPGEPRATQRHRGPSALKTHAADV